MKNTLPLIILLTVVRMPAQVASPQPQEQQSQSAPTGYILGPNDQVNVYVKDLPDEFADKTFRIEANGDLSLPVIGHLHAAGLTTAQLEDAARAALAHELKDPRVAITLAAFGSQSISILGAVNAPGIRQIENHKSLFDALSMAGGLRGDAGYQVTVTRDLRWGAIPLPQATTDSVHHTSTVNIKLSSLMTSSDPAANIAILPGDIISVPVTERVFVVGSVIHPGAFPLNNHESMSALQVVSLAEGPQRTAALNKAKILRTVPGSSNRQEIEVNLKLLMAGKGPDIQLQPDDILFVPASTGKAAGYRTLDAITQAAGYAAVRF